MSRSICKGVPKAIELLNEISGRNFDGHDADPYLFYLDLLALRDLGVMATGAKYRAEPQGVLLEQNDEEYSLEGVAALVNEALSLGDHVPVTQNLGWQVASTNGAEINMVLAMQSTVDADPWLAEELTPEEAHAAHAVSRAQNLTDW